MTSNPKRVVIFILCLLGKEATRKAEAFLPLEGVDKVEPELVALRPVSCLELGLPLEREAHVLVRVPHHGTDGKDPALEPAWALFDPILLILGSLAIVVTPDADGPLLVDVIADGVVKVELLARFVIRIVVFSVKVVHKLGGELEAAVAQVRYAEDGLESPVVPPGVCKTVLAVRTDGDIDVKPRRDVKVFGVPAENDRVDDDVTQPKTVIAPAAEGHILVDHRNHGLNCPVGTEKFVVGNMDEPEDISNHLQLEIRNEVMALVVLECRGCIVGKVVFKIGSWRRERPRHEVLGAIRVCPAPTLGSEGRAREGDRTQEHGCHNQHDKKFPECPPLLHHTISSFF